MLKQYIYKVKPVTDKIPDIDGDWSLRYYQHGPKPKLADRYGDRNVLLVKYYFPPRGKQHGNKPSVEEGDGEHDGNPTNKRDYFYIDVPKFFFQKQSEEKLGDFIASPRYSPNDVLFIKWTGWGRHSGWIDLNVQQRGAGGGEATSVDGVACAKWS